MKTATIVGFGRFGQLLHQILKDDLKLSVFETSPEKVAEHKNEVNFLDSIKEIYNSDIVFYAVPISSFEQVIANHKEFFRDNLLVDLLSVKVHPKTVFDKHLIGNNTRAMLSHPMFGPDGVRIKGLKGMKIVLDQYKSSDQDLKLISEIFESKGVEIVHLTADQHDRIVARSQGLAHYIGRGLDIFDITSSSIDTLGAQQLYQLREQVCNDTWELFNDLQNYNPYTKLMREDLIRALQEVDKKL